MLLLATNRTEIEIMLVLFLIFWSSFFIYVTTLNESGCMRIPLDGNCFPQIARDPDPFQYCLKFNTFKYIIFFLSSIKQCKFAGRSIVFSGWINLSEGRCLSTWKYQKDILRAEWGDLGNWVLRGWKARWGIAVTQGYVSRDRMEEVKGEKASL